MASGWWLLAVWENLPPPGSRWPINDVRRRPLPRGGFRAVVPRVDFPQLRTSGEERRGWHRPTQELDAGLTPTRGGWLRRRYWVTIPPAGPRRRLPNKAEGQVQKPRARQPPSEQRRGPPKARGEGRCCPCVHFPLVARKQPEVDNHANDRRGRQRWRLTPTMGAATNEERREERREERARQGWARPPTMAAAHANDGRARK